MMQIRLNRGSSGDAGGDESAAQPPQAAETVTVACPNHLVLADLPVAKNLGAVTASAVASGRTVARRSSRSSGQKVHFCVKCDFPIAIYGRLMPCTHTFCLACARNDSSCYFCDERIQKIQTIRMMEGIFVCGAPHCLKSFLKISEFKSHVKEIHADLLPNMESNRGNDTESMNIVKPSLGDPHKQSSLQEQSTASASPKLGFSLSSNSQIQDREERPHHQHSKYQLISSPPPPQSQHQQRPVDQQANIKPPQGLEKPYNQFHRPQSYDNRCDYNQLPPDREAGIPHDSSLASYVHPPPPHPPNYSLPVYANQVQAPTPLFSYPFPADGYQPQSGEMPHSVQRGTEQGSSVLGVPHAPTAAAGFFDTFTRACGMPFMGVPFTPVQVGQGTAEGFANSIDSQGHAHFPQAQGAYGFIPETSQANLPLPGKETEQQGGSGDQVVSVSLAPSQMPQSFPHGLPPPPPLPSSMQQPHLNSSF